MISGDRLHLHMGPIDLIIRAWGRHKDRAYGVAVDRFQTVLDELVSELPILRRDIALEETGPTGIITRRMWHAAQAYKGSFVTPMAAVAGAVADEIRFAMCEGLDLDRVYVNNGGDISVFLRAGHSLTAAVVGAVGVGAVDMHASSPARGLATSGWRGRSHSLGIADAVTVLAPTAAAADVAATMIANAVDLPGHPAVTRTPADDLSPDSDLGPRLVTIGVGFLNDTEIHQALAAGRKLAGGLLRKHLITGAALFLGNKTEIIGGMRQSVIATKDTDSAKSKSEFAS